MLVKVDYYDLQYFKFLLETTRSRSKLLAVFNKKIFNVRNFEINNLKKEIYICMINNKKNRDKYNKLYQLYQSFKENRINYDQAWELFIELL